MHEIRLYGELHRFVPVLAAAKGFRTAEVVVQHRPRQHRPIEVRRVAAHARACSTC